MHLLRGTTEAQGKRTLVIYILDDVAEVNVILHLIVLKYGL
jgi:hypothetical protein